MTQLHAREKPAPKRDRHGKIIAEAPLPEPVAPVVKEEPEVKAPAKKAASKKKGKGKK
tara:strand:+ start:174 stop:347 length:174 start_codon:yes stop_codon:yes gene_type:complete